MGASPRALSEVARLPDPADNVAIATETLEAGCEIFDESGSFQLANTVLEGHRFVARPVASGEALLSWGLPFGWALRDVEPGDYACNAKILRALAEREVDFALPRTPNFEDDSLQAYSLDEESFRPGAQVEIYPEPAAFMGYERAAGRGVGTRNYIVVLATSSRAASLARVLEERLAGAADDHENLDGVVAAAHTEGGESGSPNNLDLLLRTLAGFAVHPNVGAVLVVDGGPGTVDGRILRRYMRENGYPLDSVPYSFLSLGDGFSRTLRRGEQTVRDWLPSVAACERTEQPLSGLKAGLQCGGSDAFSGISANPLVSWVAREIVRHGGSANLAETDELIGAEEYVLKNVRDLDTARAFLEKVERFKERVAAHGHTAEGNPSGGNNFRGLYNIALKSIGAARKLHPDVRLDRVIDYGERMQEPGFYFMDSPGNDLESVAGQVAAGCNLIYFTTGNGSITNFPFMPTIKVVTTTGRYRLLEEDMDVNAGVYLDGEPMDGLGEKTFELTRQTASGRRTVGERAGHSQVSIWRDWRQTGGRGPRQSGRIPEPSGEPLTVEPGGEDPPDASFEALYTSDGPVVDLVGLIMPTSLCSGQIARRIAHRLNEQNPGNRLTRFVALPHTEGCGVSGGSSEETYVRTVLGYLTHPSVGAALLLEHGCEKTHNDYFRNALRQAGFEPEDFGWASIQLEGGIENVTRSVEEWFERHLAAAPDLEHGSGGPGSLRLGLYATDAPPEDPALALARLTRSVASSGGIIVVPEHCGLLRSRAYLQATLGGREPSPTLAYGQAAKEPGFHVMQTPSRHWVETSTGLGATGVELMVAHVEGPPLQSHRMVPLLQVSGDPDTANRHGEDLDLAPPGSLRAWPDSLLELVLAAASREYRPLLHERGNVDFQVTRGAFGVSM